MARESGERLLTIGAVCRRLQAEFPDVSISKIRYLEDQGLLAPPRTQGGYRLFGDDEVERLRTILRLQRDEFLPLRVIRQELASPSPKTRRRRPVGIAGGEDELGLDELCEQAGIDRSLARELEEFGLIAASSDAGGKRFGESDVAIAHTCARMTSFGIAPRHLRAFRTAADREAGLLEQLVAPALRSRHAERRQGGLEDLQALGELAQELSQLLRWRHLRRLAAAGP